MGTPHLAACVLESLTHLHEVVAVYTRPDAVRARGKKLDPSPVKLMAQKHNLPVFTPKTLCDDSVCEELAAFNADVFCVAAYGAILPQNILNLPSHGCLNVHASLLPRWRGAAPIERAILAGDSMAGVCIMKMEAGLDTGDYCVNRATDIAEKSTQELTEELADLGASALLTALAHLEADHALWTIQDESQVTYAKKIEKGELDIRLDDSSIMAQRKVRASSEAHPSRLVVAERFVTVLKINVPDVALAQEVLENSLPGDVVYKNKRLFLVLKDAAIEIDSLRPDGKQSMDAKSFAAGIQGIKSEKFVWRASSDVI